MKESHLRPSASNQFLLSAFSGGSASPRFIFFLLLLGTASGAIAQSGDRAGEEQPDLPSEVIDFPSPPLSPQESLAKIIVKDGFRVELIAAEPLIGDPVAMDFDEDGRLWVVEMRGYMRTIDGEGEHTPISRVVILDDTDGDGVMDSSTVFLDNLTQPRGILCTNGGALIIEPPDLWFCKDTTGDGRSDVMRHLYSGFAGLANPEHAGNGLIRTIDNWIHTSQHPARFRFDGESIIVQQKPGHGQWGVTQDNFGRIFQNTNSDGLRGDFFPAHYASRNRNQRGTVGINERILHNQTVWPLHPTPGINRGYQKGMLRDDEYSLTKFTAACGPCIYRGTLFPVEFHGDAFICEPSGNLVKRVTLTETDGRIRAENAYVGSEFLYSTDERFRPVNIYNGPDGSLFVVDLYRGIIQHRIYMTSFLRKQVELRGLNEHIGLGRIYRVVPNDAPVYAKPRLGEKSNAELAAILGDAKANGWMHDTAQRLLVERSAVNVADALRGITRATGEDYPHLRVRALWTLEGIGEVTVDDAVRATTDRHPQVRRTGIRLMETKLSDPRVIETLAVLITDTDPTVRTQLAFSLGEGKTNIVFPLMHDMLTRYAGDRQIRSAIVSGLHQREVDILELLLFDPAWNEKSKERVDALSVIFDAILAGRSNITLQRLLEHAARERIEENPRWQIKIILEKVASIQKLDSNAPRFVLTESPPRGWADLIAGKDDLALLAKRIDLYLYWEGRPGMSGPSGPRPLTTIEVIRFERGRRLYRDLCMSCHQLSGRGQPGTAPALADNDHVNLDSPARLIRVLLHGLTGPLEVQGVKFNASMPKSPAPSDTDIAAILTYVRRAWNNTADPVTPEDVARIRKETRSRQQSWTVTELRAVE